MSDENADAPRLDEAALDAIEKSFDKACESQLSGSAAAFQLSLIVGRIPALVAEVRALRAEQDAARRDSERLDWLQTQCERDDIQPSAVVLGAWWSGKDVPDGFSVSVGELIVDANEWPSLRDAIDAEMTPDAARRAGSTSEEATNA